MFAGFVGDEVGAGFPFEQADARRDRDGGEAGEEGEEEGGVEAVHVEEVEFDLFGGVLGGGGEVDSVGERES